MWNCLWLKTLFRDWKISYKRLSCKWLLIFAAFVYVSRLIGSQFKGWAIQRRSRHGTFLISWIFYFMDLRWKGKLPFRITSKGCICQTVIVTSIYMRGSGISLHDMCLAKCSSVLDFNVLFWNEGTTPVMRHLSLNEN